MSSQQAEIIIESIQDISIDESTHVSALSSIITSLGSQPFNGCKFNFGSALNDVSYKLPFFSTSTSRFELVYLTFLFISLISGTYFPISS